MLNKIIKLSLQNRLFVVIISGLIAAIGIYVATRMEVDVFPDLNAPTVVVMTEAGGMAAEEVERLVTFHVETALNGATNVRRVRSTSTTGFSVVWVEFNWETDIYIARQIVSEKLAALTESLPPGIGTPIIGPQASILGEMMMIALTSDSTSQQDLRTFADWTIRPRLLSLDGVAQVAITGGDIKEYQILMSPQKMQRYGVTVDELLTATRGMNQNASGGILYQYGNEYIVRGMISSIDAQNMGQGVIKNVDGQPILIEDVAQVVVGTKSPKLGVASEKGRPAVLVTITKQPNTGTIDLTERIDKAVEDLRRIAPSNVNISNDVFRQSRFIDSSINNIQQALLEGALFVVIILFIFLMNGRVMIISLVALPLSLLMAILVLKMMGMTINTMSLGGMAIAIGSLVDDAIIDVENVFKRLRENFKLPREEREEVGTIVFNASREIRTSIVNATIITIIAFVPLFFLDGMEGRMLKPLGVSFIVSLFSSLIVALTLTPVMCRYMITSDKVLQRSEKEPFVSAYLKRVYGKALEWMMARKLWLIATAVILFVGAAIIFTSLGRSFLPPFNEGSLTINAASMPGISLEESDRVGRAVEQILMEIPEIQTLARRTGRAELDEHALGVNSSEYEAPFQLKDRSREEFLADVRKRLGTLQGVNIEIGQPISHRIDMMLSGTKANIAIKLFGEDLNKMFSLGNEIKNAISDIPGIADLNVEQQVDRAQLQIVPRREILARYGITLPEFAEYISVALLGEVVSQVYDNGKAFDITVKVADSKRNSIEAIENLMIDAQGSKIPLSYVARVVSTDGPNAVSHENAKRKIVISANVTDGDLGSAVDQIQKQIGEKVKLPEGYFVEYGGQFESQQAASRILLFASIIALLIIYLILLQEFKNTSLAAMVMLNLPLAMIGGVIAIWLSSGVVSIPAVIGFISLLGIAVRNGILLVSRYRQLRASGMSLYDSVISGSMDRLNPILMTSLTSALALIPLAMGGDLPGNEIQSPMAIVILGGLISSTLLNGFIIPAVYLILNKNKK